MEVSSDNHNYTDHCEKLSGSSIKMNNAYDSTSLTETLEAQSNSFQIPHNVEVIEQALKDLRREIITINGHLFRPPTRGGVKQFAKALGEALERQPAAGAARHRRRAARAQERPA